MHSSAGKQACFSVWLKGDFTQASEEKPIK